MKIVYYQADPIDIAIDTRFCNQIGSLKHAMKYKPCRGGSKYKKSIRVRCCVRFGRLVCV